MKELRGMEEKLRECPFCGSKAKMVGYTRNGKEFEAVQCTGCRVHNANIEIDDYVKHWNSRQV